MDQLHPRLSGVSVASKRPRHLAALLFTSMMFLQITAFLKWAMLDLNQRPPPCKGGMRLSPSIAGGRKTR